MGGLKIGQDRKVLKLRIILRLKNVILGKTRTHQNEKALSNLVTIIGPSGNGKSTLADVFGFIADCLEIGVEAACYAGNRGGYDKLISQGAKDPNIIRNIL